MEDQDHIHIPSGKGTLTLIKIKLWCDLTFEMLSDNAKPSVKRAIVDAYDDVEQIQQKI